MIKNLLTEQDILEYLMTSDFNEGLTNDESKFLLLKYRNFYRVAHSKNENLKMVIDELTNKLESTETKLREIENNNLSLLDDIDKEKNRELSWKERISGNKKSIKKNE